MGIDRRNRERDIPVLLNVGVGLVMDVRPGLGGTRTVVVVVLFDADLFFGDAGVFPRRKLFGNGSEGGGRRRVITFPSGLLRLLGKFDLKLLVGLGDCLGLGLCLCLALLVGGGKDAEGDGDTGFKIQIGDLEGATRRIFSAFPYETKEGKEEYPLASFS